MQQLKSLLASSSSLHLFCVSTLFYTAAVLHVPPSLALYTSYTILIFIQFASVECCGAPTTCCHWFTNAYETTAKTSDSRTLCRSLVRCNRSCSIVYVTIVTAAFKKVPMLFLPWVIITWMVLYLIERDSLVLGVGIRSSSIDCAMDSYYINYYYFRECEAICL